MEMLTLSSANEKTRLDNALLNFARAHQLPTSAVQAIDLALEEHLANVFNYGFEPGRLPEVVVLIDHNQAGLTVEVSDNGKPFNPLEHPEPDINRPLEDRPIGGLGIHLIRKFVDQLTYRRDADRNILTMCKRVS